MRPSLQPWALSVVRGGQGPGRHKVANPVPPGPPSTVPNPSPCLSGPPGPVFLPLAVWGGFWAGSQENGVSCSVAPGCQWASGTPGPFVGALWVLQGEPSGAWGWGPPALPLSPSSPQLSSQPPASQINGAADSGTGS